MKDTLNTKSELLDPKKEKKPTCANFQILVTSSLDFTLRMLKLWLYVIYHMLKETGYEYKVIDKNGMIYVMSSYLDTSPYPTGILQLWLTLIIGCGSFSFLLTSF